MNYEGFFSHEFLFLPCNGMEGDIEVRRTGKESRLWREADENVNALALLLMRGVTCNKLLDSKLLFSHL